MSSRINGSAAIDRLFDAVAPQDLEAERSVLGSCLLDSAVIDDVAATVRPGKFASDAHRKMFAAILSMHERGEKGIDAVTLAHELEKRGELKDVGGVSYVVKVLETVPHAAHADHYSRIVRDKYHDRALVEVCTDGIRQVQVHRRPAEEVIPEIDSRLLGIQEDGHSGSAVPFHQCVDEFFTWFGSPDSPGIPTGFYDLDELVGGLRPGSLYVIAARPSMGKTAFMANIAVNLARSESASVTIFSKEQKRLAVTQRVFSALAGMDLQSIRNKDATLEQRRALHDARELARSLRIHIRDVGRQSIVSITATLRPLFRRGHADVAIIDYLQLLDIDDQRVPREQQVAAISRALKGIATDLNIPVIVLAQLNRGLELREDKRPRLADLRESGAIEQDADVVMFLHRQHKFDANADPHDADLFVEKNRDGRVGSVKLHWQGETVTFRSAARTQHLAGPR